MICASCGAANREGARFCDSCGAPLDTAPAREQRKVVTVLFCDVTGSTALGERLDPEALRAVMARYFEAARAAIERHGGTLEKFIGDAVMAVFGVPTVREDDALRAVRAAQEIRDSVEVEVRIGVNTGEVVTGSGDSLVTGDAVNVAARLEQAAAPGEVLIGAATHALVRDAAEVELLPSLEAKGKAEPLTVYRLGAVTGDTVVPRRLDAPLVGRDRERRLLGNAWERAVSERAAVLFTILGAAGVGKSRLAAEFLGDADATVVRGRCLSYGDGITYWPVVEIVKQLLRDEGPSDAALAALLGDGEASADEIAFAVRKLLERAAAERPLVVLFDDIQWGEPTFLDLIEHVADWSRDAPILLLCLARPDLLDVRGGWGGGKLNATTVLLEPLTAGETDELIDALLSGRDLDPALRERIRTAADGNPLFVEQMLAMVEESTGEVTVPATIQALLSARLDQLPPRERAALERGAVEGHVFHRGTVAALAPDDPDVTTNLLGLVRKELVRPSAATLPGDDAFRFRHLLIRDAAYDALPKSTRGDLHERFATWVEERAPDLVELDEIVGYHLEQAATYRAELGTPAPQLASAAAERLAAAGRRAETRDDPTAARSLLSRAVSLLDRDDPRRAPLLAPLARALYDTGELDEALRVSAEGANARDLDAASCSFFFRGYMLGHQFGPSDEVLAELRERVALLEADGGDRDEALALGYFALAWFAHWRGNVAEVAELAPRALHYARRAPLRRIGRSAMRQIGSALCHGTARWEDVERYAREEVLRQESRRADLDAVWLLAIAAGWQARFDEAASLWERQHRGLLERGLVLDAWTTGLQRGLSCMMAGRYAEAAAIYRESWDALREMKEYGYASTIGAELARALASQGRTDEARAAAHAAEAIAPPGDWVTVVSVGWARATASSADGRHDEAVALMRAALDGARQHEYLDYKTELWFAYGVILADAGRDADARAALKEALRLAELKGSTAYAVPARERLDALRART